MLCIEPMINLTVLVQHYSGQTLFIILLTAHLTPSPANPTPTRTPGGSPDK